ncbi:MAG: CDP-alcohol phosphatidyltransferase family protein [Clostridia bacterium]|nr:CDP-alcohol phosphatidyltransferase family protein [Clostridia bacterium]
MNKNEQLKEQEQKEAPVLKNEAEPRVIEKEKYKSTLNVPNMLSLLRVALVPAFIACLIYIQNPVACGVVTAIVFAITGFTDFLDGKIARKYNLVTDFGKFIDAVADKIMIFGMLLALTGKFAIAGEQTFKITTGSFFGFPVGEVVENTNAQIMFNVLLWASVIVFLRELGVTSIRLVCANKKVGVIPANFFGKAKTVTQILAVIIILVEFAINESNLGSFSTYYIASYIAILAMLFMTVASGINYLRIYGKYINTNE